MMGARENKKVLIIAVLLCVVTISVGFAAFATNLRINATATVTPDASTFGVVFSSSSTKLETDEIKPTKSDNIISTTNAKINNNDTNPTISNISAVFTSPGQSVSYSFYARNIGKYKAYLTSIVMQNLNSGVFKQCISGSGTTDTLTQKACSSINVKVTVSSLDGTQVEEVTTTKIGIENHILPIETSEIVTITFEYDSLGTYVDGPFEVKLGDIYLTYGTAETNEMPNLPTPSTDTICVATQSSYLGNVPSGDYNPGDEYVCNVSDTESHNFYVLSKSGDKINLIMSENYGETVETNGEYDVATSDSYAFTTHSEYVESAWFGGGSGFTTYHVSNANPPTILSTLNTLTSHWDNLSDLNESYTDMGNNYTVTLTGKARLATVSEIRENACKEVYSGTNGNYYGNCPSWIIGNYWTMDTNPNDGTSNQGAWAMSDFVAGESIPNWGIIVESDYSSLDDYEISGWTNKFGIRPVITLLKSNFKN